MTVLFCDLVGFTSRSDRADPEDVRAILRPFHELAKAEIERYGGTLDKFIGDAAMGVFGSPAVREDDPERAVRAALAIVEGTARLSDRRTGEPLSVRVGVNTGEAVVTLAAGVQMGENVAGDVVNTASRLQSAAPTGRVLVGEATYRATREAVQYEELEPVVAKGKAEPLRVWRAVAVRALPTISDRPAMAPFVGRRAELALLERTLMRALREPSMRLATVIGEPGVGKSRLVAEVRAALPRLAPDTAVQWRRGRCLPYGEGITFWALGEIVKGQAGILESDPSEDRHRKLSALIDGGRLVADPAERAWLRARLSHLVGADRDGADAGSPVERDEAFAAWRRFLEATAAAEALVTVFEDIHWADPSLLAFLEDLAEHARPVPLLVIATARPELYDRHPAWGSRIANSEVVSLAPLSEEETATLVSDLLRTTALSAKTRALLLERSGGNPLYAEEFARTLKDRGLVDDSGDLTGDVGDAEFPPTVQALIAARLDLVAAERKALLQDASVIGRVFWSGGVAYLGDAEEPEVRDHLNVLADKELVRTSVTSGIEGQAEYVFWHGLIRDVAYAQIPRAERASKHRRAAEWIEAIAGERLADMAEILTHHATSALELARSAGETAGVPDLEHAAARYLRLAGLRTMAMDVAKAEAQLLAALALTKPGDLDRARALASLGEAAFHAGRLEEAEVRYEEAITSFRSLGEIQEAADAMVRRSVVLEYRGETAAGTILLANAIELLEDLPPGPELARALATSAGSSLVSGRYQEAVREADRAIELADRVGERTAAARARGFRGYVRALQGDPDGVEEQRAALSSLREAGLGRATAVLYNNLASCLLHLQGPGAALDVFREGVTFAETRGLRESVLAMHNSMLTVLFEVGDWDKLLRLGQEVVEEARRQGSGHDEVYAEADRAVVLAYREGPAAVDTCESVLERARPLQDAPLVLLAIVAAGLARNASRDHRGVVELLAEALDITGGDAIVDRVAHLPELVRLAVAAGDVALAGRLPEGTEDVLLERYRLARMAAEAVLAEARGQAEHALKSYLEVAKDWSRWGYALERAHALFGAGRCLTVLGRTQEARQQLEAAAAGFAQLGAEPVLAEVQEFLP